MIYLQARLSVNNPQEVQRYAMDRSSDPQYSYVDYLVIAKYHAEVSHSELPSS